MSNGLSNDSRWASVRKRPRKDGTTNYSVSYRLDGIQSSLPFDNEAHADALVALIKAHGAERALAMHGIEAARRRRPGHDASVLTVAKWVDRHTNSLSGIERKTRAEYRRYLTRDIEPTLGQIPLTELQRTDISGWVNQLRDAGNSQKTIGNKLGFLSGCLNAAVAHKPPLIDANPAVRVKLPRTVKRQMVTLTVPEYQILKSAFTEQWHPFLDFLVTSGTRVSEATAAPPAAIERQGDKGRVTIFQAWKKTDPGYELGAPKSERGRRSIPIPTWVIDNLDLTGELIFTNTMGGPIRLYSWRANVWYKSLKKACTPDPNDPDKPYLTKRPRIHDLRHTAASWWLSEGVPLVTVSALLGHEDVATTARIYAHLIDGAGQAAADAMSKLLG